MIDSPFPTTLPVAETTELVTHNEGGQSTVGHPYFYTATIHRTRVADVTKIDFDMDSAFTGPVPTQLGSLSKMSMYFSVQTNELTSTPMTMASRCPC